MCLNGDVLFSLQLKKDSEFWLNTQTVERAVILSSLHALIHSPLIYRALPEKQ